MAAFIEKTPEGVESYIVTPEHEEQGMAIHYRQDIEPVVDYCAALRKDGLTDGGIKNDMWHYAQIPPVVIMKLKNEYGVDIFNRNHYPKLFKLLNTEFRYLKTTDKRHTVKH